MHKHFEINNLRGQTMRIEFIEKNCNVGDKLKEVMTKKLEKLDKYFVEDEANVKATLKKAGNTEKTEVMLDFHGNFVRAEVSSLNFYDNVEKLLPKLEGQIRKYRTKWDKHQKNVAYKDAGIYTVEEEKQKRVVRDKHFRMSPMTIDEAIEQMELLGHSFYVYIDAKTQQVNVVYLRADGDLGVIETEV